MLEIYLQAFVCPSSYHANGDYERRGVSTLEMEAPSLEGGLAAAAAVNELLLQSWSGKIRLFPGLPDSWDASFRDLRAEDAFLVSAERVAGKTGPVSVTSLAGALCVLVSPFPKGDAAVHTGEEEVLFECKGDELHFHTAAGQTYLIHEEGDAHPFVFRSVPAAAERSANFFGLTESG